MLRDETVFLSSIRISHLALSEQANAQISGRVDRKFDDSPKGRKTFENSQAVVPFK